MITESQDYGQLIKCSICRHEIKDRATLCQNGVNYGVVCVECYQKFSGEDLELMANLFLAFGGYFGQFQRSEFSILRILKAIHTDLLPVYEENGIDLRDKKYLNGNLLYRKHGIYLSHYAFLFPSQVIDKAKYYANYSNRVDSLKWAENNYLMLKDPFRVHIVYESPSWLKKCCVKHNEHVINMYNNINTSNPSYLRNMDPHSRP